MYYYFIKEKKNLPYRNIETFKSPRDFQWSTVYVFPHSTLFSSFLTVLLSVCVLFLSGGASVILSLGLVTWCDTVTDHNKQPFR